jgi:rhodanese-related sulfurtransferase
VQAIPEVDAAEAHERVTRGGAVLLDVREIDEWNAGHAPDATHLPMSEIESRVLEIPHDRTLVAICRSGARSGRVVAFLIGQGYDAVNVTGGMKAWHANGLPMIADTTDPPRVA